MQLLHFLEGIVLGFCLLGALGQCFSNYVMWRTGSFFFNVPGTGKRSKPVPYYCFFLSFLENIRVPADDGIVAGGVPKQLLAQTVVKLLPPR